MFPELTSPTVHKAALACVPRSSATPTSDRSCYQRPKRAITVSCASDFGKMPRRTRAELARDKARKLVQNLFDKFKDPVRHPTVYSGYLLQLDGPPFFDDNDLTRLQIKLLPFDVSDTAIPNSAPSFFKPWPVSELKDHPVDVKAMGGEDLEALEIDNPFSDPSNPLDSARDVEQFIDGQYFHVPRANLNPGFPETLSHHSNWRLVS
jgi:hypothetical protein